MSSKRSPVLHLAKPVLLAVAVLAAVLVIAGTSLADSYEGKVDGVRIAVWRYADKNEIETLVPGDTLKLQPGQRVILRLFSPKDKNPTGERQYLSAEITVEARGSENVELSEANHDKGSASVHALRSGAGKKATLRYRLLGKVEVARDYQAASSIPIEIAEAEDVPAVAPPPSPPAERQRRGVTLYEDSYFRGDSETFYEDKPDLRYSRIKNDRASSVRVPEGCTAYLYRDSDYKGEMAILRADTAELGNTPVGNDAVSSLKVVCH